MPDKVTIEVTEQITPVTIEVYDVPINLTKAIIDPLGIDAATVNGYTVNTAVPPGALFTDTTYSIQDGELSEKNFTSALKTKLDGIAPLATIDQDKANIDALNINADQVDGYHATTADTLNTVAVRDASKDITAHDFIPTSDKRKKWNIRRLRKSKGTEGMEVVSYCYKGEEQLKFGLIAQELKRTHPELVKLKEDGFYGLYSSSIQGLIIYDIRRLMKYNLVFMIKRLIRWLGKYL